MRLFKSIGCNQLSKLIALTTFIINYIGLLVFQGYNDLFMTFAIYPSISFFSALAVFLLVRLIYWIFNGFQKYDSECE